MEPSDEDDQATILEDNEVNLDTNINQNKGRSKKGRRRKHIEQSQANVKLFKNSNLSYFNYKNKKMQPKKFKDFDCLCPMKCVQKVLLQQRRVDFENFWKIGDYTAQNAYIAALVNEIPVKRRYAGTNSNHFKKQFSRKYTLNNIHVCRKMFCETLNISTCRVNTALKKIHGRAPLLDQRGLKSGGLNKISDEKLKIIKDHIDKIPKYKSHYCREQSTFQYLLLDMTLDKMYAAYKEENITEPVSFSSYKRFFYDNFNLKFKSLKKDTCNTCDSLNVQITNEANPIKKQELILKHTEHLNSAENAQKSLKNRFGKIKKM